MIEVRIPEQVIARLDHPIHLGIHILNELRAAGVPALGSLWPQGAETGTLSVVCDDLAYGGRIYQWEA